MSGPGFIHLHVHSAYSLLEGALPLAKVLDLAKYDKQPALGIADTNNLFGALEFSEKAAGKGIQPLLGCELVLDFGGDATRSHERRDFGKGGVVLMALDAGGFGNLSRLVSKAYLEGQSGSAAAKIGWLSGEAIEGIVCLSGGPEGAIDPLIANGMEAVAAERLDTAARGVRRPVLRRAPASRAASGGHQRAPAHRLRLPTRRPAGRDQRAVFPGRRATLRPTMRCSRSRAARSSPRPSGGS